MLPRPISEPQWNSTALEGRSRRRSSRASLRTHAVRWLVPLAVLVSLALLLALGFLLGPPAWLTWETTSPSRSLSSEPTASPSATTLGQRVAVAREISYLGKGWAFLGQYSIPIYDPGNSLTWRADFALDGETSCDNADSFQRWAAAHYCLLREQVGVALRSIPLDELLDPQLDLLRRRLVTQVNRMMDDPFLKSVHFKEFHLYQSVDGTHFAPWQEANQPEEDEPDDGEESP